MDICLILVEDNDDKTKYITFAGARRQLFHASTKHQTIYSYKGVFSNTLNWALLPTDVTAGGGESSYVYVN